MNINSYECILNKQNEDADGPDVCVCITCYNQKNYIGQCLESVVTQKDITLKILVGDDCSTDGSIEILRSFQERFPLNMIIISHDSNVGVNKNRNSLLELCDSRYVAFLDGDDYYIDEHCLKRKCSFLDEHKEYIGYFSSCYYEKDGIIIKRTDFDNAFGGTIGTFNKYEALHNNYPGLLNGFMIRNIYRYMDVGDIKNYYSFSLDESSKMPIFCGNLAPIYRDNIPIAVYRYVETSSERTKEKRNMNKELWLSHIEQEKMVSFMFGEHMRFDDQMYTFAYNSFVSGIKGLFRGKTDDWNQFYFIYKYGYLGRISIILNIIKRIIYRFVGKRNV